jgi:hypothetical protein
MRFQRIALCAAAALTIASSVGQAADLWQMTEGHPNLKSAGALTFGPDGILIIGDAKAATVFAVATGDTKGDPSAVKLNVSGLNVKVAKAFDTAVQDIQINDLAVNPASGRVYLSVTKGSGDDAAAAIARVHLDGSVEAVSLESVKFSKAILADAPVDGIVQRGRRRSNPRDDSITDLAYVDGKVIVSGLSNSTAPSSIREIAFPFVETDSGSSVEIFHGAHGGYEAGSAIRTFVPFNINGEPALLAGYVCTPLVKFPLSSLKPGSKTRGTTIAELGNQNRPLDMIVYEKGGSTFLLMANDRRGVMKISTDDIARKEGITERIADTAGQSYEKIGELEGVVQLDKLNETSAVILVQADGGVQNLQTVPLP